ncbi:VWA domain-containing protein [Methylobacillus caricis]|uniref:VWA domain-containing protein n=1 Tax=Methylobacillus caricis TaxID=1971611 RepID=UPI001CFF8285|nr:VWA domain-containing protein [Methylobacillus caricis]MCB5188096.1 VWA domain-containing protein [Methylobacillus caricis]
MILRRFKLSNLDLRGRLMLATVFLLVLCMFQPHATLPRRVFDWFFVLDITQSMNVRDYTVDGKSVSRLEYSKKAMREALRDMPCGSTVALGMFTERGTQNIVQPLEVCAHFSALDQTIDHMDWRMAWAADSFITHGVLSAVDLTAKLGQNTHLAFFTDGHQAPPSNPDYLPKFEGKPGEVRGILAGTGKEELSRIPKLDEHDNIIGYWELEEVMRFATFGMFTSKSVESMEKDMEVVEDDDGLNRRNASHGRNPAEDTQANLSGLDEKTLKHLAEITGLDYGRLGSLRGFARDVTSTNMASWRSGKTDLRPWFALPALLLILAFFMPPRFFSFVQQHLRFKKR